MKRYGRGGVVYVSPYKSTQIKHNVQVDCTVILSERNTLSESVVTASTRVSVTKLMFYELPILRSNSHYINFLKELVKLLTSPCECSGAALQVLFHVATAMPSSAKDPTCNEKRKYIGNDYVSIVYNDSGADFNIHTIKVPPSVYWDADCHAGSIGCCL